MKQHRWHHFAMQGLPLLLLLMVLPTLACRKQTPEQMLMEAKQLLEGQDALGAELKYKEFLKKYPKSPQVTQAHWGLAACYSMDKQYEKSREHLDKVIQAENGPVTELAFRAMEVKLYSYIEEKQPQKALSLAIETSPTLSAAPTELRHLFMLRLSDLHLLNGQDQQSIDIDQKMIAQNAHEPDKQWDFLVHLAWVHLKRNDVAGAIKVYQEFLQEYPETPMKGNALYEIGLRQLQIQDDEASSQTLALSEAEFRKKLELAPGLEEKSRIIFKLVDVQRMRRDYDGARQSIQSIIKDYPNSQLQPQALFQLVRIDMEENKTDQALVTLHKIIQDYPNHPVTQEAQKWIMGIQQAMNQATTDTLTTSGTLTTSSRSTDTLLTAPLPDQPTSATQEQR